MPRSIGCALSNLWQIFALVVLASLASDAAGARSGQLAQATYHNPVLYADYSDPDVIRVGRFYYLVASSFHFSPGIPVLRSQDLVHWQIIAHVLPRLDFAPGYDMPGPFTLTDATSKPVGEGQRYAGGVWAPALRYHHHRFYIYWPTPNEGIFMSTASHPQGPWTAPVTVLAGPGYEDPCPFWDKDGRAYLIHSKVGAGPLILHRLSPDGTHVLDEGHVIVEDKINLPVLEGPKLYRRQGWIYIFAPVGGVGTGGQAVLRSHSIEGPYEHRLVLSAGTTGVQGPHQGGYVETPSGQGWFLHFNQTGAFGRITYLEPVRWEHDWPIIGQAAPGSETGQPVAELALPLSKQGMTGTRIQDSDEFDAPSLGLQWEWNHNPDNGRWSLCQRPGFLRLHAGRAEYLVTARNTLTQILQGPSMQVTTRLDISHLSEQQRAGLVLFGVKPAWIGVVRDKGVTYLTYASSGIETRGARLETKMIEVRATITETQKVQFALRSRQDVAFSDFGPETPLAKFSWWKGSRPGLFTYVKTDSNNVAASDEPGYIDIDWFRVKH